MTGSNQHGLLFCVALAAALFVLPAAADDSVDIEYAEKMPRATQTMLLDITRAGNTLVAVGERGHVVTSTDDGKTWTQSEVVPTRSTLTTVFSVGERLWAGGHDAVILTSGDKGRNWTRLFYDPERNQAVMDIYFTDENHGIAVGSYGLYLYTSDGGENWLEGSVDEDSDYHLNGLVYFGDGKWLIAGEAGSSYRSYDNGETWEALNLDYQGSMWGGLKTSDGCVLFFGLRGHVMQSCDFGTSWTPIATGSESSISGAVEHDGLVLLTANGGILLIRNDSSGFRVIHHSSGVDFAAAVSLGDGSFLLSGEEGVHSYPDAEMGGDVDE